MKKTIKAFLWAMSLLCVLAAIPFSASASPRADIVVSLQLDNPIMQVNGVDREIDTGRGTVPMVINGRTLVPIRAIIETFGGTVTWNGNTNTATLTMGDDVIDLTIGSTTAIFNNRSSVLDVAPAAVNGRTMLPLRFVAESFNLGVAWDGTDRRIFVVSNTFDDNEYNTLASMIPEYRGYPYAEINGNQPFFKNYEIIGGSFEFYADLDDLGRCDVAMASVGVDLMPTEERESISSVTPSGWINAYYDVVSGGYLYNRCHLIGFQLTGENANDRNLVTGTRYLNIEGMLPFENRIDDYVESAGNHVIYRVTPVFKGDNLVADGILMEAYSVEDNGSGISFCVYCYNVQPQIKIDYTTGASYMGEQPDSTPSKTQSTQSIPLSRHIYRTPTGKRYHYDAQCGGKNSFEVTLDTAISAGLTPCAKCAK